MTTTAPRVIWNGAIEGQIYRVVDNPLGPEGRLFVEIQAPVDAMGGHGWNRFEPIPRRIFEAMMIQAGVIK